MTRISTAEMYDDKDVITQICKLKDGLNSALGGIIADIDIVNDELVIDWADGESIALPLPSPTGISSIAGSVSGGNLTMTIYMTDGSSHAFTCPLNGMATEAYVDTKNALNAKLAENNVFTGINTVPDLTLSSAGGEIANKNYVDGKRVRTNLTLLTDLKTALANMKVGDVLSFTRMLYSTVGLDFGYLEVENRTGTTIKFSGTFKGIESGNYIDAFGLSYDSSTETFEYKKITAIASGTGALSVGTSTLSCYFTVMTDVYITSYA